MDKNVLREQVLSVNDLLSDYIKIHNDIFNKQGTILSLFKTILGNKIDYWKLKKDTENLLVSIVEKQKYLNKMNGLYIDDSNSTNLFNCLFDFTNALLETVTILDQRQAILLSKRTGNKVSWEEYKQIEQNYKTSINKYKNIGGRLNTLFNKI